MNEKRVKELQDAYMAHKTTEELIQIILRKNLEPDALEAANRELKKRGRDPDNISENNSDHLPYSDLLENNTKVCPYCAEEIKTAAILCRYCGKTLDKDRLIVCPFCAEEIPDNSISCKYCNSVLDNRSIVQESSTIELSKSHQHENINGFLVFFYFLLIIIINALVGYWLYWTYVSNPGFSIVVLLISINLITRLVIGSWALKDRSYNRDLSSISMAGVMILAFIPIGSWFAIYYAARHLASQINEDN